MRMGFFSQNWIAFIKSCKALCDHNSSSKVVTGTVAHVKVNFSLF